MINYRQAVAFLSEVLNCKRNVFNAIRADGYAVDDLYKDIVNIIVEGLEPVNFKELKGEMEKRKEWCDSGCRYCNDAAIYENSSKGLTVERIEQILEVYKTDKAERLRIDALIDKNEREKGNMPYREQYLKSEALCPHCGNKGKDKIYPDYASSDCEYTPVIHLDMQLIELFFKCEACGKEYHRRYKFFDVRNSYASEMNRGKCFDAGDTNADD